MPTWLLGAMPPVLPVAVPFRGCMLQLSRRSALLLWCLAGSDAGLFTVPEHIYWTMMCGKGFKQKGM